MQDENLWQKLYWTAIGIFDLVSGGIEILKMLRRRPKDFEATIFDRVSRSC